MGTMTFQLPAGLPPDAVRELERSCLVGGPDIMPWWCERRIVGDRLLIERDLDESGYLAAPWAVADFGTLMGISATLMERTAPYDFLVELARGKVNQFRNQAAEWQAGGLQVSDNLGRLLRDASQGFGKVICSPPEERNRKAQNALELGYRGARELVDAFVSQIFRIRHQRQPRLETTLSCRLGPTALEPELGHHLVRSCNRVCLPMSWHTVEFDETRYRWDHIDRLLDWAEANQLDVMAGPLIDFSSSQLPKWLWAWEGDLPSMATFMARFVEAAIRRYRARIRRWQLTAASNWADVLGLSEDDLLSLTFRLGDTARQVDPALELVIGVTQPWGEYMVPRERTYSPFIFADNLIRSRLNLAALDVEVVMGVSPRGSYCRDLLEFVRLLDLYALLGVPLRVTIASPSEAAHDPEADPELTVGAGHWHGGFTPAAQADWARSFLSLALCRPFVQGVQWAHFADSDPHQFPHCGLLDRNRKPKPVLEVLADLRERHLL